MTPRNNIHNCRKLEQFGFAMQMVVNKWNGIADSVGPDQTVPFGTV